ncbi:uncharacterized protein Z519_07462 [Cladophialophora bantiana CBS 173.52]|uniref:Zn(2)-C6 fungal-type domain-containing protein n=1 Tax=Cladophialophora bantiana (strain ATCC 10958 / CBS 173.52 / CDC B-1940 / NIH 8579) TaxID=1442370 RepID=A0A0D2ENE3_CLAB1|nr:uncharacterized protein Z519_07462 [Cladophialophora bantiana CBS 173.52]KIW91496.1 hypothetical protein Z519_07462 [Cladophialophora bantiana CBS 173.52]
MDANKVLSTQTTKITFESVTVLKVGHIATSALKPRQIKDRSGCLACKRRRVKCDDAKPTCKHCETRGDVCERAADVSQWRVTLSQPRQINDGNGCLACKRRKVKCDKTLPSCRHCQRRNEPCQRPSPPGMVVSALPRLPDSLVAERGIDLPNADWDLLNDWCDRVCRILCNFGRDSNPLSFSMLETLTRSRAATHTLQSLSAGYRGNFSLPQATRSLEERSKALKCLREEIDEKDCATEVILFTVIILGHSAGWLSDDTSEFGLEHLLAANTIINGLLRDYRDDTKKSELFYLALGMFLYWDMTCSFLAPLERLPIRNPLLAKVAKRMDTGERPHSVVGISSELLLLLGSVGRLCRRVWETNVSHPTLERKLEAQLLQWQPPAETPELEQAIVVARCFRSTGLIMLYGLDQTTEHEESMAIQVKTVIENLKRIPESSPYYGFQAFVLAVVSSEVMDKDSREFFVRQFHQLYKHNRLRANYQALQLTQEIWAKRDLGRKVTLPQIMGQKGWSVMLG